MLAEGAEYPDKRSRASVPSRAEMPRGVLRAGSYIAVVTLAAAALLLSATMHSMSPVEQNVNGLIRAIESNDNEHAQKLIGLGLGTQMYRPAHFEERWCYPVHIAAMRGNHHVLGLLLTQRGTDPNARDFEGRTPLMYLCDGCELQRAVDYLRCLEILVRVQADVNAASQSGETALHIATHPSFVAEFLLRSGADPNRKDVNGDTPLHTACAWGRVRLGPDGSSADAIPTLLLAGADPELANNQGQTPRQLAVQNKRDDITAIFERYSRFLERVR
jgi:ankyrin repeat protein